ncbi:hypothetical protein [Peptoniphilus harei]|uniref:Uncharacterized protein n=1 Tax=Peptoniphilus harei TaxID=54005 RepID=A0A943XV76_9FIRM|nr:hypothetical protein [Peptoniphilus harei]MBS6535140.1 hypothetical protein [Peptoniphilus harei]
MVLKLIGLDLKKILDKNALLMGFFGLVFTYLSSLSLEKDTSLSRFMGTEGLALIFLIFAIEFSKGSLQDDKIRKKIEFFLANGVGIKFLVIKYFGVIYLASLLTLLPSLIFFAFKTKIGVLEIFNFLLTAGLYTNFLILKILNTENMNKMAGIQNKIILLGALILVISTNIYIFTSVIELYLISKFLILIVINIFMVLRTNKERIGVTYF